MFLEGHFRYMVLNNSASKLQNRRTTWSKKRSRVFLNFSRNCRNVPSGGVSSVVKPADAAANQHLVSWLALAPFFCSSSVFLIQQPSLQLYSSPLVLNTSLYTFDTWRSLFVWFPSTSTEAVCLLDKLLLGKLVIAIKSVLAASPSILHCWHHFCCHLFSFLYFFSSKSFLVIPELPSSSLKAQLYSNFTVFITLCCHRLFAPHQLSESCDSSGCRSKRCLTW